MMAAKSGAVLSIVDHDRALAVLESTAERVLADARLEVDPDAARRLVHLGEDLSSHALAARVLVTSGASSECLQLLLARAADLLDDQWKRDRFTH